MVLDMIKPLLEGASGWLDLLIVLAIAYFGIRLYLSRTGASADDRPLLHRIVGMGQSLYARTSTSEAAAAIKHMNAVVEIASRHGATDVATAITRLQPKLFVAIHGLDETEASDGN